MLKHKSPNAGLFRWLANLICLRDGTPRDYHYLRPSRT